MSRAYTNTTALHGSLSIILPHALLANCETAVSFGILISFWWSSCVATCCQLTPKLYNKTFSEMDINYWYYLHHLWTCRRNDDSNKMSYYSFKLMNAHYFNKNVSCVWVPNAFKKVEGLERILSLLMICTPFSCMVQKVLYKL